MTTAEAPATTAPANGAKPRRSTKPVYPYTQLIADVSAATGVKKAHVRRVLEDFQLRTATYVKENVDGRVHLGRLCTFYSRLTSDRLVNNPQKPGERIESKAHLVLRIDAGSRAKEFLAGASQWDTGDETE